MNWPTRSGRTPTPLRRLLRSLVCFDVFDEQPNGAFTHTDISRLLREDAPDSLKYLALWCTEPWTWELWGHLDEAVRTGKDVFVDLYGGEFFEYLHTAWPESAETFDLAMTQASKQSASPIVDMLPMQDVRSVADVAGGQGHVLATLLERYPDVRGVLLDLPDVIANADPRLLAGGALVDRVQLMPGDCREQIPLDIDIYFFKNILGMQDDDAVVVLRNVAKSAPPDSTVIIVENFVDDGPGQRFSTGMDLRMLLSVGGRKHTKQGLLDLVSQSGLIVRSVEPVNSYQHMIQADIPPRRVGTSQRQSGSHAERRNPC